MMFLTKQHHIAIISSDYAKAKDFYIDKLGFELYREVYRPAQNDYLRMLRKGDTVLELFIRPDAPARVNNPDTGLEEMIALAAEGLTLIRSSEQLLAEAELKIQKLEQADTQPPQANQKNEDAEFSLI